MSKITTRQSQIDPDDVVVEYGNEQLLYIALDERQGVIQVYSGGDHLAQFEIVTTKTLRRVTQ